MKIKNTIPLPVREIEEICKSKGCQLYYTRPDSISAIYKGVRYVSLERFKELSRDEIRFLEETFEKMDWGYPTSVNAIWRKICPNIPKVQGSLRTCVEKECEIGGYGGWQEDFPKAGDGAWNLYDLKSAYAWAGMDTPMPDTETAVVTYDRKKIEDDVLYYVKWNPRKDLPDRLRYDKVLIWGYELNAYYTPELHAKSPAAWKFEKFIDLRPHIEKIFSMFPLNIAKVALRQYWGIWESDRKMERRIWKDGQWIIQQCGNRHAAFRGKNQYNPVWARTLTGKVWLRCWYDTQGMRLRNVYVDAVMVDQELPTGEEIGDWRLKRQVGQLRTDGAGRVWDGPDCLRHCGTPE